MRASSFAKQISKEATVRFRGEDILKADEDDGNEAEQTFLERLAEPYAPSAVAQDFAPKVSVTRRERPLSGVLKIVQEWEGSVIEVEPVEETFSAFIYRLGEVGEGTRERMVFEFSDEAMGDKNLIVPGAIFRWVIGYLVVRGSRRKVSQVIFRRLPGFTASDAAKAEELALRLQSFLACEE